MYTISKEFHFSASHQIVGVGDDHPCARLHGHNYVVIVELQSLTLDDKGFVRDYLELKDFKELIDQKFDHRHLNDISELEFTSAEYLAKWFYNWCNAKWIETSAVTVCETPKTRAEYRPQSNSSQSNRSQNNRL